MESILGQGTVAVPASPQSLSLLDGGSGPGGDLFRWHGAQLLFLPLLIVVGLPGNALVMHVYRTRWPSCTYSLFVRVLACLDLGNCLVTMPLMLIHFAVWSRPDRDAVFVRELARAPRYFAYALTCSSGAVLLVISIDRYIKICWPMKPGIRAKLARRLCCGVVLSCLVLTIPAPLLTRGFLFKSRPDDVTVSHGQNVTDVFFHVNVTGGVNSENVIDDGVGRHDFVTVIGTGDVTPRNVMNDGGDVAISAHYVTDVNSMGMNEEDGFGSTSVNSTSGEGTSMSPVFEALRVTYLTSICLVFAVGTLTIVVLYALVWKTLITRKRTSLIEGGMARKNSRVVMERTAARSARVFTIVTVAFFLVHVPHFVVLALYVVDRALKEDVGHVGKAFLNLAELSPFLNSVINPLIYSFTSPRFRRECAVVFSHCCSLQSAKEPGSSIHASVRRQKSELVTEELRKRSNVT